MSSPARIAYLDTLRFALVALVVPLHAYYVGFAGQAWIATLHDSFHMAALFLISGYFAAPAVAKIGGARFGATRGRALLPPLLVILGLSLPTLMMHQILNEGSLAGFEAALARVSATGNILLHGWFLAVLLIYMILAGGLSHLITSRGIRRIAAAIPASWHGLALIVLATLTALPAEWLWNGENGPLGLPLFAYEAIRYLWAFALGIACWHAPQLFDALHRIDPRVVVVALVAWALTLVPLGLSAWQWEASWALRRVASALVLIPLCLMAFRRFANVETATTRALSQAGMTVFVTQWALLYVLMLVLPFEVLPEALGFWVISALALALGIAFHHLVVKRSRFALEWIAGIRRADPPSYA
jgi:peptidoglycan/LPS O-acetylase OafA/YrhL